MAVASGCRLPEKPSALARHARPDTHLLLAILLLLPLCILLFGHPSCCLAAKLGMAPRASSACIQLCIQLSSHGLVAWQLSG